MRVYMFLNWKCVPASECESSKYISDFLHLNGSFVNIFFSGYISFCRTKLLSTVSNTLHIFICGGMKCQVSVLFIIFSAIFWKLHLILNWIIVTNEHKKNQKQHYHILIYVVQNSRWIVFLLDDHNHVSIYHEMWTPTISMMHLLHTVIACHYITCTYNCFALESQLYTKRDESTTGRDTRADSYHRGLRSRASRV